MLLIRPIHVNVFNTQQQTLTKQSTYFEFLIRWLRWKYSI